jgi:hypothetical protein
MFNVVLGYLADQRVANADLAWGKALQITTKNTELHSLTVTNKGAACWVQVYDSASGVSGNPREYPLPADSVLSLTGKRFANGLYVRGVDDAGGSAIAGDDLQFDADYMLGPKS